MKDLIATTRANRRRYYLKQKIKNDLDVNTRKKQVSLTPNIVDSLTFQKKKWLTELGERFGYNLQYSMV